MNILAIGAHPDDIEVMCAGTLAKYTAQGHKVFLATATNGNIGSAHHTMEEIGRIRKAEAAKSAAIIGAEYICLDYDDEMFYEDKSVRLAFINLIRYCKADVILTHYPVDYNPDHELTSKIVNDVAVMGARPLWLSAAFILEEGFALADLARIVEMNRDPAVAFDARNGIDDDFAGHGSLSRI